MKKNYLRAGFTLVELAIVLVIIGLIVSGVLVGQQLIEQARIRRIITQLTQYDQAINTFRLKYDYLPGDFPQAFKFLGSFSSCTDETSLALSGTGCNGNGDGRIDDTDSLEPFLLWAHLSRAGLVAGSYTGFPIEIDVSSFANSTLYQGGVNMPWIGFHRALIGVVNDEEKLIYQMVGFDTNAALADALQPGFTVSEAYTIDSKRDDGKPSTGTVKSRNVSDMPECVTNDEYNIGAAGLRCILDIYVQ